MRIRDRRMMLAAGLILSTGLSTWATAGFAGDAISSDRRLPKNVVAYLSIRNVREFKSQWSKAQFGQMFADEALGAFRKDFVQQVTAASQELCDRLEMSLSDLLSIPEGELAVAGSVQPGGKLNGVLLLDFGQQAATVHKLAAKYAAGLKNSDFTCHSEKLGETCIISYQTKPADDNDRPRDAGAYFIKGSLLVVGNDSVTVKEVLARWDGGHDSTLFQNDAYRYILDRCHHKDSAVHPQVTWFFDPGTLFLKLVERDRKGLVQAKSMLDLLPILGIDKFKGAGGVFEIGQGEFDTVSRTLVMLDRAPQGIVNLLQFDFSAQAPPKWLSADWTSYKGFNWNAGKAYAALETLTDQLINPGVLAGQIQQFAENPASGGIHLKKDVIDQFTGVVHAVERDGAAGGKTVQGTLLALQIKDPAAMRNTLVRIAGLGLLRFSEREFQGKTFYEIEFPGMNGDDESARSNKSGMAVAEDHLLFASDVRLLYPVLGGAGEVQALAATAAYKGIARRFPSQTAYIGFSRQDVQTKSLFDMLRTAPPGLLPGLERFDFSKLPDADVLKKYLPPTGSFMEHDHQGLKITSFSLRNESD